MLLMETIKRSWELDADVVQAFDEWIRRTGMVKNAAVQLALWVVMNLDPAKRQACMDAMNDRKPLSLSITESTGPETSAPASPAEDFEKDIDDEFRRVDEQRDKERKSRRRPAG